MKRFRIWSVVMMKQSSILIGLVVFLGVAMGIDRARAVEPIITTVTGTVADANSKPIAHASVTFVSSSEKTTTQSGSDGTFSVALPAGTYRLVVHAKGYDSATRDAVTVSDLPINLQISLNVTGELKTIASVLVRTESGINITPAAVNSVTSQQIAAQGSIGLSRVLSEIPGVQITMAAQGTTGGAFADEYAVNSPANPIYLGIRGSQPYENATLYDGHRINSANWLGSNGVNEPGGASGTFNLAMLDTNSISSLDVIKGPGADSPTINNAIGGVADLNPIVPSGLPSATLSYGFDGSGGLRFSLIGQGETKNKRFRMAVSSTSYTLAGPIGGFHEFGFFCSPYSTGLINGKELISNDYSLYFSGAYANNSYSYLPHIYGGFSNSVTPTIGCCVTKFTQDTTLEQQRMVSAFYNVIPTVQVTLRYALNNTLNNFGGTPSLVTFQPSSGYAGKYQNGYQFYQSDGAVVPSHELDQLYEWDINSQIGKGSARVSYLSYFSTNADFGNNTQGQTGFTVCSPCTISGEAIIGGTFNVANFPICGNLTCGTPTIFNDQNVGSITPGQANKSDTFVESLTHDIVVDLFYPIGNKTTASLSYNSTMTSNFCTEVGELYYLPQFGTSFLGRIFPVNAGQFERFSSLHGSIHSMLTKNFDAQVSLYVNQYQYHIPNPNDSNCSYGNCSQSYFTNTYSYFTSPRFGFEWRPQSNVAVRASAGSGISPIDVSQLIGLNGTPQPNSAPPMPPTFYTVSVANPNLKPETSFGEDLGASVQFGRYKTLSLDVYNTTLHGQFFSNYELDGTYLGLPLYATQTRNLAHSKYQGLELTLSSRPPTGLFWSVQGSLQRGFTYDLPTNFYTSACGPYTTNLTIIPNQNFDGGTAGIGRVAYAQGYAVLGWESVHGFQVSSNFTYYGNNNGFYRPPFVTVDVDGVIPVTDRVSLTVAVASLTNIYGNLYYQAGQFSIIPYVHASNISYQLGDIGQTNTVQNVGPRHISATLNFKL